MILIFKPGGYNLGTVNGKGANPELMNSQKVEKHRRCHAELDSASNKNKDLRDPETSSG